MTRVLLAVLVAAACAVGLVAATSNNGSPGWHTIAGQSVYVDTLSYRATGVTDGDGQVFGVAYVSRLGDTLWVASVAVPR